MSGITVGSGFAASGSSPTGEDNTSPARFDLTQSIDEILKAHSAVLVGQRRHPVYRFRDGKTFVRAKTAGVRDTEDAQLQTLRRWLGGAR